MNVINGLKSLVDTRTPCVATIGNFDGLHLGHQAILKRLKQHADTRQLPLVVISFEPLPAEYFAQDTPPTRIYPFRDKVKRMSALGVDDFLCLRFDTQLANYEATAFVENILIDALNVSYLAVGDDFKFGYKRQGNFSLLQQLGQANNMQVHAIDTQCFDGERISSTRIRTALNNGDLVTANQLLGHTYQLSGRIRHGDKRGRTIGFPTLNVKIVPNIALKFGVYAVKVHGLDNTPLTGVANLGNRPTVDGSEVRLETHLFDFDKQVYGKHISVEFIECIRAEQKFASFEALQQQIQLDSQTAQKILAGQR